MKKGLLWLYLVFNKRRIPILNIYKIEKKVLSNFTPCILENFQSAFPHEKHPVAFVFWSHKNVTTLCQLADKPICVPDQKRIYGVARHEDARIACRVEAYPAPDSFRWAFNNTEEMVDMPQARYKDSTHHTQSVLTYKPVTEMDYGTVLCWASNTAGQQKNACIFHVIPAGRCHVYDTPLYICICTLENRGGRERAKNERKVRTKISSGSLTIRANIERILQEFIYNYKQNLTRISRMSR